MPRARESLGAPGPAGADWVPGAVGPDGLSPLPSQVLKKISKYIQEQNEQVYAPRGLLLTDPVERGMRVVSSWAGWAGGHGAGKMGTDEPGGTGAGTA